MATHTGGGAEAHLPRRVTPAPPRRDRRVCPPAVFLVPGALVFGTTILSNFRQTVQTSARLEAMRTCAISVLSLLRSMPMERATLFRDDVSERTLLPVLSKLHVSRVFFCTVSATVTETERAFRQCG